MVETKYQYLKNQTDVDVIHERGKVIYEYLCTDAKHAYNMRFNKTFMEDTLSDDPDKLYNERKFALINKDRFNPINFGINYHNDGYDGIGCFHYSQGYWYFSLYNDNGVVDCSVIAKSLGGGGHKGAAGFRVKDINSIINQ